MTTSWSKIVVCVCLLSISLSSLIKEGDANPFPWNNLPWTYWLDIFMNYIPNSNPSSVTAPWTDIAEELNAAIDICQGDFYGESCGNKGVLWRKPADDISGPHKVVAASLITNEIYAPTKNYQCGAVACASSYWNPVLGYVINNKYVVSY